MKNIQTILFDLDGTLLNTNELIIQSFMHTFNQYGLDFTREQIVEFNGPPLVETFEKIDPDQAQEMIKVYRDFNHAEHETYVTAFPGVMETLEKLQALDVKVGIVTTKLRYAVNLGMNITGLDQYFDTVITLEDVTHAKPHPEPVLKAMEELGGIAETTLMIGDNAQDIEAGQHAGVQTAGVAWSQRGAAYLEQFNPTYMLQTMTDLLGLVDQK